MPVSSRFGLALPAFEAARRRFSALAGSCHQQYSCGGSTVAVHGELSRFVPAHLTANGSPLPRVFAGVASDALVHDLDRVPQESAALRASFLRVVFGVPLHDDDSPRSVRSKAAPRTPVG